jgi:hypothetical protein
MNTSLIPAALIIFGVIALFVVMSLASLLAPEAPEYQDFTPKAP